MAHQKKVISNVKAKGAELQCFITRLTPFRLVIVSFCCSRYFNIPYIFTKHKTWSSFIINWCKLTSGVERMPFVWSALSFATLLDMRQNLREVWRCLSIIVKYSFQGICYVKFCQSNIPQPWGLIFWYDRSKVPRPTSSTHKLHYTELGI